MRSHRVSGHGSWLLAVGFVLMPAFSASVRAQPGYGPDPFWPYNSQYAPYTSPIGPASPEGGQGGAMLARPGFQGANQYQDYLDSLGGTGRNFSDRAGVGVPYYRSAVPPDFDLSGRGSRQYRPNSTRANATFEQAQREVSDKYFAYYAERDPTRRAELMREYRDARRQATRAVTGRTRSPSRVLDSSSRLDPGSQATDPARAPSRAATRAGSRDSRIGPAPPVPLSGSNRPPSSTPRRGASPSDVLRRSQSMDPRSGVLPGSRSPATRARRSERPAPAQAPSEMDSP